MSAVYHKASDCAFPTCLFQRCVTSRMLPPMVRKAAFLAFLGASPWLVSTQAQTTAETPQASNPPSANPSTEQVVALPSYTVTAEKMARPAQEVPMAVVAIDAAKVEDFQLLNFQDVQRVSPGLDVNVNDPRNPVPTLRGITFNPDSGTTAAVDVYWNEIAVGAPTAFRAMYDVGQIEVLRGPQGTLRGRSSPGGAITIATRKPDMAAWGGSVVQTVSAEGLLNTQVAINLPLAKDKLALRLAGLYDANNAGDIHDIVTDKVNRSHTKSFRATLEWKPVETIDLTFVHQYLHQILINNHAIEGSPIYSATLPRNVSLFDRISVNPGDAEYKDSPILDALTIDWKLPGANALTAVAGFQDIKQHLDAEYTNLADIIPNYTRPQTLDIFSRTQSYELRFSSVRHPFWNYIFGLYYERTKAHVEVQQVAARLWFDGPNPYVSSSPTPRAPDYEVPLDLTTAGPSSYRGLFTTQTFQLTKQLRLEAGARYQQIKAFGRNTDIPLGINGTTSRNEKPTTGSASLSYQFDPRFMTYVTYGRAYRPGGEGLRTDPAELEKYLHYRGEKSDGLEAGIKSTWLDNRLQFNADVYYQKFKGYISQSGYVYADSNFDGVADNTYGITFNGDARTQGVETGLTAALPYRFVIGVDASYNDAKWTSGQTPANVTNAYGMPIFNTPGEQVSYLPLKGTRLGDTPRLEVSSHVDWSKNVSSYEVFARTLVVYKGSRQLINVPNPHIGGYYSADLFSGIRDPNGKWSLTIWAKNLLNRDIVVNRGAQTLIGLWPSGYLAGDVAPAREVGVTVDLHF
jgi:iron complex outermembrane recepter protein